MEEFRCTEGVADKLLRIAPPGLYPAPLRAVVGIPIQVRKDVPEGKLQLWRNGKLVQEIDV